MDNGDVIPGLGEKWSFMGATAMEWISGASMGILMQEFVFGGGSKTVPLLLAVLLATTFGLAGARKKFPDEEKGVANALMVKMGVFPPRMPAPAELQPIWSGAPLRELDSEREFRELRLDEMFELDSTLDEEQ